MSYQEDSKSHLFQVLPQYLGINAATRRQSLFLLLTLSFLLCLFNSINCSEYLGPEKSPTENPSGQVHFRTVENILKVRFLV